MIDKGQLFEKEVSLLFHSDEHTPVLVSSKLLRARGMGQIDSCFIKREKVFVAECKSGRAKLSRSQLLRLQRSAYFLGNVLAQQVQLIGIQQVAKVQDGEYPFKVCNIRELM